MSAKIVGEAAGKAVRRTACTIISVAAVVLTLGACAPEAPNAYSSGYSRVTVTDDGASADGRVRKGYDRSAGGRRTALLPDACITPDVAPDPMYLPSGCANAVNLQQMAENERDLERGQEPGPSMAAPSVRAARRYLDGGGDASRRSRLEGEYSSGTQVFTGGSMSAEGSAGR